MVDRTMYIEIGPSENWEGAEWLIERGASPGGFVCDHGLDWLALTVGVNPIWCHIGKNLRSEFIHHVVELRNNKLL